jgi:hypothetical protein
MISKPGIVAKSNIRLIPETHLGNDPLDVLVCQSSNAAARDLFLGNGATSTDDATKDTLTNHALYPEHHLPPPRSIIKPGDLVVIFESFTNLNFVYATPTACFSNRNGHFPHDDFIGKPYGCKIRSRNNNGLGFLYLLRPTAELWGRSLPHRTQIVHELVSMLIHYVMCLCLVVFLCMENCIIDGSQVNNHLISATHTGCKHDSSQSKPNTQHDSL